MKMNGSHFLEEVHVAGCVTALPKPISQVLRLRSAADAFQAPNVQAARPESTLAVIRAAASPAPPAIMPP